MSEPAAESEVAARRTFGAVAAARPAGLRSGIIGAGFMGQVHARAVRSAGGTVAAVASSTVARGEAGAAELGAAWAAPSAQALIASPTVDVVHVCTPNHTHADLVRAAITEGKHVVCEKPLATTVEDAQDLVERAAGAGLVCAVPFVYRYYPTVLEARARLATGELGAVHLVHGSYLQDWLADTGDQNWRVDPALGGASRAFADIGVHWCDLVEFATGHRITSLSARLKTAVPVRVVGDELRPVATEDAATLVFETDHGAVGSLVVSQVTAGRKNRLWFSLDAAKASFAFDQELPDTLWMGKRDGVELLQRGASLRSAEAQRMTVVPAGHPQGYQDCFNALVADVYARVAGRPAPGMPTFADGLRAARLTAAVLESAACARWVDVA
ncbi:MAG: Gfo/Idh/MocA family oxidoreductase [Actinobacteria bacterium]|nr:Gfo/Idh/MocA family oxidoreductase [Actinomycetota bacterium]